MKLPVRNSVQYQRVDRIQQQNIKSKSIKPFTVSQINLINTQATLNGPFSLANGSSLSILSVINNTVSDNFRIGAIPYSIIFFEGVPSINQVTGVNNIIGYGVTGADYQIKGPLSIPQFTPYGSSGVVGGYNGQNILVITELHNVSAGTNDIYYITDTRVLNPYGGGA